MTTFEERLACSFLAPFSPRRTWGTPDIAMHGNEPGMREIDRAGRYLGNRYTFLLMNLRFSSCIEDDGSPHVWSVL
ncbi:hypothetical protein BJY04DRAFT_181253 [Aspergillus karnatakaensis]|uniref:uncharacterized protein n=1 Tax=Aspergillus karnatakaensis TaxID=1810916 RepID=UPI003CCD8BA5